MTKLYLHSLPPPLPPFSLQGQVSVGLKDHPHFRGTKAPPLPARRQASHLPGYAIPLATPGSLNLPDKPQRGKSHSTPSLPIEQHKLLPPHPDAHWSPQRSPKRSPQLSGSRPKSMTLEPSSKVTYLEMAFTSGQSNQPIYSP